MASMETSAAEEARLVPAAEQPSAAEQPKPVARSCCGEVAYTVGKNTAAAYLKTEGEVPVATQHFNKAAAEKRKNGPGEGERNVSACCIQ